MPATDVTRVRNDKADFYGRDYYGKYVTDLGYPDLASRARTDLPERCLHWLRAILKYRLPPAKALELGSAHGGLVALLRWAGFDARGLELSPSIVKFARQTFGVPTLLGPVEDQKIAPRSLDVVALMDVLEHLPDPVATTKRLFDLLKPGGVIVIQTPRYAEGLTLDELAARHDRFVEQLKPREHLFLFSQKSVRKLLRRHGAEHVAFEPAIFAHYDMFLVASRRPLKTVKRARIAPALTKTPSARMIQCLLDAGDRLDQFEAQFQQSEADRAARLEVIQRQGRRTVELEAEIHRSIEETRKYSAHVQQLEAAQAKLTKQLEISEADRAARLEVIQQQGRRTVELEAEIHRSLEETSKYSAHVQQLEAAQDKLTKQLEISEADRAARLEVIQQQGRRATELEAEVHRSLEETGKYSAHVQQLETARAEVLKQLESSEVARTELSQQLSRLTEENRRHQSQLTEAGAEINGLRTELERRRVENESLVEEKRAQQSAFAKEKLDLLGQLDKTRGSLAAAEADRARMSADIAKFVDNLARLEAELARVRTANESLTRELQASRDENRDLASRLDARSRALDGAVKSLDAARARIKELNRLLTEIDERWATRFLKASRLWPR